MAAASARSSITQSSGLETRRVQDEPAASGETQPPPAFGGSEAMTNQLSTGGAGEEAPALPALPDCPEEDEPEADSDSEEADYRDELERRWQLAQRTRW